MEPPDRSGRSPEGFQCRNPRLEIFLYRRGQGRLKNPQTRLRRGQQPLGMNCFACHAQAKAEFDLICVQDHGCDPIPVTRALSGALQRTDPRCKNQQPVSAEDAQPLKDLGEVFKALKASKETDKQYIIAGWRCACEHLVDPGNADGIDLCQSGPVRVSEAIKEVYYEHRKESCSHHRRVARYWCGPRQGIS